MTHKDIKKITIETSQGVLELIPSKDDEIIILMRTDILQVPQRDGSAFKKLKVGAKTVTMTFKLDNPYITYKEK